jgi:esterase/lipase
LNAASEIFASLELITTPFLCLAAGVEKLVDPFAALELGERSRAEDKRVVYCEDMWHVMTEEEQIDGVGWHCAHWLKERLP